MARKKAGTKGPRLQLTESDDLTKEQRQAAAMGVINPDWLKAKPWVMTTTCITVVLEDGLVQDVSMLILKVERPMEKDGQYKNIRVEVRNYDVFDDSVPDVVKDESGREYVQTLYWF